MRREIPLVVTFTIGILFIVQFFVPHPPFNVLSSLFQDWYLIIAGFAIILGVLNIVKVNGNKIYRRKKGRVYSLIIVASFLLMATLGVFNVGGEFGTRPFREGTPFNFLYRWGYIPLNSTMFAMLAFFIASASYRAFRARNREATLLLIAAFVVMLGQVPIGHYLSFWLPEGYRLNDIASWIMSYPNMAGQRAIMIGIALGIISTSLRLILGIERAHLAGGEGK